MIAVQILFEFLISFDMLYISFVFFNDILA